MRAPLLPVNPCFVCVAGWVCGSLGVSTHPALPILSILPCGSFMYSLSRPVAWRNRNGASIQRLAEFSGLCIQDMPTPVTVYCT